MTASRITPNVPSSGSGCGRVWVSTPREAPKKSSLDFRGASADRQVQGHELLSLATSRSLLLTLFARLSRAPAAAHGRQAQEVVAAPW